MQKSCLKCRPFALFQNFRGFGSKMKKNIVAITDFLNLQYARKLQSFLPRCIKELSGKSLRNNIVPSIFLHKAVIKRECGIHCFKSGFE